MRKTLAALILAVPASMVSTSVMSAAGVVEATPFTPGQTPVGGQGGTASSNDALVMLLDQFREMRAELETLRGMVEEQNYELRNLQRESLDRYTDLDSRLSALSSATAAVPQTAPVASPPGMPVNAGVTPIAPAGAAASAATSPVSVPTSLASEPQSVASQTPSLGTAAASSFNAPVSTPPSQPIQQASLAVANNVGSAPSLQPTVLSEQQQYQMALDSLLQEEQYQRSVTEFDQYLNLYPNGRFVTNAYYWKGQAYINLAMLNEAREAFETIVNQYPDGRKVDDAMYSLGTVYDKLGNPDRAQQLLRQVQSRFPNTSAANLADIYLRGMN